MKERKPSRPSNPKAKKAKTDPVSDTIAVHCAHVKMVDVTDLKPNPRNPNQHGDIQVALLAKNIRALGWRHPIIVSNRSGLIVAGHARLAAAQMLGCSTVPVDHQDFDTAADEMAYLIADNRIAELAEIDNAMIKDLLQELDTGEIDTDLTGFTPDALEELMLQEHQEEDVDAEPQVDRAEELAKEWGVERGQLWGLGDHSLLCGDATAKDDVAKLLRGAEPMLMVTDPPYGVEYDANWRNEADRANGKPYGACAVGKVVNDDRADWSEAYALFPGHVAYVWHPAGATQKVFQNSLESEGFDIRMTMIWAKNQFPIGRGHYHVKHEPCFYAVRKGGNGHWGGDRKQTTLWQIDKPHKSETGHSTQKPVECMARPIRNHKCSEVYEPFSGSGTTIIACEQLGRTCYAIEISPGYVAVALQRYLDATGKRPELIDA